MSLSQFHDLIYNPKAKEQIIYNHKTKKQNYGANSAQLIKKKKFSYTSNERTPFCFFLMISLVI